MPDNKSVYMHTLNGQPAYFSEQVSDLCFAGGSTRVSELLVESLEVIRQQQDRARISRHAEGLPPHGYSIGYLRFKR